MKIGITLGDPSGIAPEIILKGLATVGSLKDFLIFANNCILKRTARDLHLVRNFNKIKKHIVNCVTATTFQYGKPNQKTGRAAIQSINSALKYGVDILITPPIVKKVITRFIPNFIGHTEYLAHFYGVKEFAMVGIWRKKRIMLFTTHMPLHYVFQAISAQKIYDKIMFFEWGLKKYFKVQQPSISVSSLNPHSFEFSTGEDEQIQQGIKMAQRQNLDVQGPFPADTLFRRQADGYLTMYHDQAMIYLKSKTNGLNFTMGLPIIRISPLYGAALDIAGKNKAEVSGFVAAIKQAKKISKNVRLYEKNMSSKKIG